MIFASGFLVNQSTKAYAERATLRNEQNKIELLLLRSLSKLATTIDFNSVFEIIEKEKINAPQEEAYTGSDEIAKKAKDLAIIMSHLNKMT